MNSVLEQVDLDYEYDVIAEEDDIIHVYCNECYPEVDSEISLCGMDLSDEKYVAFWEPPQTCAMCMAVVETLPRDSEGRLLCPKGHVIEL